MQDFGLGKAQAIGARAKLTPLTEDQLWQMLRIMKIAAIILLTACLQVSASGYSQKVTLNLKDAPLNVFFEQVERQTDYRFVFTWETLKEAKPVTLNVKNAAVEEVIKFTLKYQPIGYIIEGQTIIVSKKKVPEGIASTVVQVDNLIDLSGLITDEQNNPLQGVNVSIKNSNRGAVTNYRGEFLLKRVSVPDVLVITSIGYDKQEIPVTTNVSLRIQLKVAVGTLDELQVIGYGTTSKRLSTGSVSTIRAVDIAKQPINNPLLAMQGRIPGIDIFQLNGLSGGAVSISIRGQNSLSGGNDPLFIIDGVPYTSNNLYSVNSVLGYTRSGNGSPFSFINPADIESIDVLKDADATAIYGSRGANGVVLITTKKGKAGQIKLDVNIQSGFGKVVRKLKVLNTRQYLDMRYEALKNDGISISSISQDNTNYDITVWDTTRNTDWQKELIGGNSRYNDIQVSTSGGAGNFQFLIGSGYHKETTVFPGDLSDQKASVHFNINASTNEKKFWLQLSGNYLSGKNNIVSYDLTEMAIKLAPNSPEVYNPDGSMNWALDAAGNSTWTITNPLSRLLVSFKNQTNNLVSNGVVGCKIFPGAEIKTSLGYTNMQTDEIQKVPLTSIAPLLRQNSQRLTYFGNNNIRSWIIEPEISYRTRIDKSEITALIGSSFQKSSSNRKQLNASGFNSDLVMEDIKAATAITVYNSLNSVYKYNALFGRVNYNFNYKYIVNLTARSDGSSRYGPANRFHNFAALGLAWVFSKEPCLQKSLPFLSFGKVKASYGTTGSDQVGDYTFMDLYNPTSVGMAYQGAIGNAPDRIYTPDIAWEETRKMEAGIEWGIFNNRITGTINFYRNRSSNQLVSYLLPAITGFTSVWKNLDAVVQNKGWEFELRTVNLNKKFFKWSSSINLSLNRNKLISGAQGLSPELLGKIGYSLYSLFVYHYTGVDPFTGLYTVADLQGHPTSTPNPATDKTVLMDLTPKYFGGLENTFEYKGIQLDFLISFVRQKANQYLYNGLPGFFSTISFGGNQPTLVLDRWQKPGDVSFVQKYTTVNYGYNAWRNTQESDREYGDASYVRLKNLSLSWQIPADWRRQIHLQNARIYLQGQNLLTITEYEGLDPETRSSITLPPLRVITIGINITI